MSSHYTTHDLAGWEPIEATEPMAGFLDLAALAVVADVAPARRPLGYACSAHGSVITRTVPGICSACRSTLRPVFSADRLAHLFRAARCFACGQIHDRSQEC